MQTVEFCKRTFAEGHPFRLGNIELLVSLHLSLGEYKEAEAMQLELLDTFSKSHGKEHPFTLKCKNDLALNFGCQAKYEEAETLQLELLRASQKEFGEESPQISGIRHSLIVTYLNLGKFEEASALAIEMEKKIASLGPTHPEIQRVQVTCQMVISALAAKERELRQKVKDAEEIDLLAKQA